MLTWVFIKKGLFLHAQSNFSPFIETYFLHLMGILTKR